jgi:hemerythrin-like domain-containing protein
MSDDAIVILKEEHQEIRRAFRAFTGTDATDTAKKGQIVDRIIELLTIHTYVENEVMYPRVRQLVPQLEEDVLESFEEHHVADVLVMELSTMEPFEERFTAKTMVLIENVEHHMTEEEDEWFPKVRSALGRKQLQEIGRELRDARADAPRRPSQPSAVAKVVRAVLD